MKISNYNKEIRNKINELAEKGDITIEYYWYYNYKFLRGIDHRSRFINNMWYVKTLAIYNNKAYVLCPYCNHIHSHSAMTGHRASDCGSKQYSENRIHGYEAKTNVGYEIEF